MDSVSNLTNIKFVFRIGAVFLFLGSTMVHAQLSTRGDLLVEKYEADRAKGLVALNRRYLEAFQDELNVALQTKKLEEANLIQTKMQSLNAEIIDLEKGLVTASTGPAKVDDPSFIVGKTLGFEHPRDPLKKAYFSFQGDGKAFWLGAKDQSVERSYKPTGKPRQFLVWWEQREDSKYQFTLAEDGKTAQVVDLYSGKISEGTIEKTD